MPTRTRTSRRFRIRWADLIAMLGFCMFALWIVATFFYSA